MNRYLQIHKSKLDWLRFVYINAFLELELIQEGVWLAGGSLRTLLRKGENQVSDYDLFFKDLNLVPLIREKLIVAGFKLLFECPEGKLFTYKFDDIPVGQDEFEPGMKIQLICEKEYISPLRVIADFDFFACMLILDQEYLYIHTQTVKDVQTKNLTLNVLTYPIATLKRIVKYAKKGYRVGLIAEKFVNAIIEKSASPDPFSGEDLRIYID